MTADQKDIKINQYPLPHGWKINLPDITDLLENNEGKVAIILKSKSFGDVSPIIFDVLEYSIRVHSLPHFVDDLTFSLDKEINIEFNPFVFTQE